MSDTFFSLNNFVKQGCGIGLLENEEIRNNSELDGLVPLLEGKIIEKSAINFEFLKKTARKKLYLIFFDLCKKNFTEMWR